MQYFGVDTMATGIYRVWRGMGDPEAASQLAALLLIFVFVVFGFERWSRGSPGASHTSSRYRPLPRYHLKGWLTVARSSAARCRCCSASWRRPRVLLGWALEQSGMLVARLLPVPDPQQLHHGAASRRCSASRSRCSWPTRCGSSATPATSLAVRIAGMGYAIPGTVLAIGVLLPFAALDHIDRPLGKGDARHVARPDPQRHARWR